MRKIKIERIKNKKKIIIGSLIFIIIIATLILITSKAKYKNIQSIDLASGTINYTPADIDIVAIYQENDSGEYENVAIVPSSGYTLSSDSYCNVNGSKDTSIKITYENGLIGISDITKKVKCTLYFDKIKGEVIVDKIKALSKGSKTSFTAAATTSDTGIYSAPDDYGVSYYFRGNVDNNWVKFAGFYWRIVRINGNNTIRMIYSGVASGNVSNSNKTGMTTQINEIKYAYNLDSNDNTYLGYMIGLNNTGTTTNYEEAHSNLYDSNAKKELDKWYKTNILDKNYENYISIESGFCNDRSVNTGSETWYKNDTKKGYGSYETYYGAFGRVMTNGSWRGTQNLILTCPNKERDLFTHKNSNIGNKKLLYPIGLITVDEGIYSGSFYNIGDTKLLESTYLYTGENYWTMSPRSRGWSGYDVMYFINGNTMLKVSENFGLRPVINLCADTRFTGTGSETDPYIVV